VGKTTLAANLAHGFRRGGRRVVALDLDPQNALRLHFGLPHDQALGFIAELPRHPDWRGALHETPSGVALLPYGATDAGARLALGQALDVDPELLAAPVRDMLADPNLVVVVDTPPGASRSLSILLPMADLILVPLMADGGSTATLPEVESGRFLGRGTLGAMLGARMRFVLNGVDQGSRLSAAVASALLRHLGPRLLGLVARDEAVAEALACEALLTDHAPHALAAYDLAEVLRAVDGILFPAAARAIGMPAGASA
jgi:cellulose synthase operon protein YhjQ